MAFLAGGQAQRPAAEERRVRAGNAAMKAAESFRRMTRGLEGKSGRTVAESAGAGQSGVPDGRQGEAAQRGRTFAAGFPMNAAGSSLKS